MYSQFYKRSINSFMLKVSIFNSWYEMFLRLTWLWYLSQLKMILILLPSECDPKLWKWSPINPLGGSMTFRNIFTGLPCLLKGMSAINIFRRTLSGGGGQQKESSLYACENVEKIEPLLKRHLLINGHYFLWRVQYHLWYHQKPSNLTFLCV